MPQPASALVVTPARISDLNAGYFEVDPVLQIVFRVDRKLRSNGFRNCDTTTSVQLETLILVLRFVDLNLSFEISVRTTHLLFFVHYVYIFLSAPSE